MPTLTGLGDSPPDPPTPARCDSQRRMRSKPDCDATAPGCPERSGVDQRRPVTLREGLDDELAVAYRLEAERILASGVFFRSDLTQSPAETLG